MSEVDDIAIENDVLLSFETQLPMVAAGCQGAARKQMLVANHFSPDEAPLDVRVDFSCGELRRRVPGNRPRPALVFANREERDVAQEVVARADDPIETRFTEAKVGHERVCVRGVELRNFELDLRADGNG